MTDGALSGRVALITGASRGFGRATALRFAQEGADLILNYHRAAEQAEEVARTARELGRRVVVIQADVSQQAEAVSLVARALDQFGRIDVLVNNAGVMHLKPFIESGPDTWGHEIGVNIWGVLYCTKAALPAMIERRSGRIINLSSQLAAAGGENLAVYSATKGAVTAFTKSLAREVGRYNITVNAIGPGSIGTDMNRELFDEAQTRRREAEIPVRRVGDPSDVAHAALYLASDGAAFVTGHMLMVNGGWIM